jgi:hypothetical protein
MNTLKVTYQFSVAFDYEHAKEPVSICQNQETVRHIIFKHQTLQ